MGATLVGLPIAPKQAHAIEFLVESHTLGDAYQLVTSGNRLLNRWQVHQMLGLSLWETPDEDGIQHWSFTSLFRFDVDFGVTDEELRDVPTLNRSLPSIQYAYAEGKGLLGGALDVRVGRQLLNDTIDYIMLDGAKVVVKLPWYLGVEVDAGLEVKQEISILAATQLELDGVRVNDGIQKDNGPVAMIGASLTTRDLPYANYRLGYRRRFSGGAVNSEHVGTSFHQRIVKGLDASGTATYDLFNGRFDRVQVTGRWRMADFTELELGYLRLLPSFDADSIFNIFTAFPMNDANMRWRLYPSQNDRLYVGGMVRLFGNEGYVDGALTGVTPTVIEAYGASGGWMHMFGPKGRDGRLNLDFSWQDGFHGRRILADANAVWAISPQEWELQGRFTAVDFKDAAKPLRSTFSVGYQLGGRYLINRAAAFAIIFEHNMNSIQTHQVRLYAMVDLNLWL